MKKENKILKNIINLTERGDIKWSTISPSNFDIDDYYVAIHKITDKKFIKILCNEYKRDKDMGYLVIEYHNNHKIKRELIDICPNNKIFFYNTMLLRNSLNRLLKLIKFSLPKEQHLPLNSF